MGTRSLIAIARPKGFDSIYVHWDGYPEYNGRMLLENYSDEDPEKREALIALGDLSSLREEIGEKHDFVQRDGNPTWSVAYGRDRGEEDVAASHSKTFASLVKEAVNRDAEWLYVWRDDTWLFAPVGKSLRLANLGVLDDSSIAAASS